MITMLARVPKELARCVCMRSNPVISFHHPLSGCRFRQALSLFPFTAGIGSAL
jgi:hypothetical protein